MWGNCLVLPIKSEKLLTTPTATALLQETFISNVECYTNLLIGFPSSTFFIPTKHSMKNSLRDLCEPKTLYGTALLKTEPATPHFIRVNAKVLTGPTGLSVISFLLLYSFLLTLLPLILTLLFYIVCIRHIAISGPLHWLFPLLVILLLWYMYDSAPYLLQVFSQISPYQWNTAISINSPHSNASPPLIPMLLLPLFQCFSSPFFIFFPYHLWSFDTL